MNPKTTVGDYEIVDGGNMGESWVDVYAADRLWTPRKINGVYFDGTKDIVIPVSGFGIGYLNTTLALQAVPEEYTTSDYAPFEEDSILATLPAYIPPPQVDTSGITYTRSLDGDNYIYTGSVSALPPVTLPEGEEPYYFIYAYTNESTPSRVGNSTVGEDLTWSLSVPIYFPNVTFKLEEAVTNTVLCETVLDMGLPSGFIVPEDDTEYLWLHNIVRPYDIAWLICGATAAGNVELAETYINKILDILKRDWKEVHEYLDIRTGLYRDEYLTSKSGCMIAYALAFFVTKCPNSTLNTEIKKNLLDMIWNVPVWNGFCVSEGTYGPGLTNFSSDYNKENRTIDNVIGYFALDLCYEIDTDSNYDSLNTYTIIPLLTDDLWNATDGCFYYSDIDHTTKDCLTQAWGAIFLKAIGDTEKLTKCLASLDQFYTICNDGQIYKEPAAGYRLTPDDDGISFEATFITALARMGNGQLNRGMSDIVSARNMFEELKGSLLINKDNPSRELPAWPTLLSVGIPLVLRKPNGLFGLDYDIHDAGNEDAVHIHDASEVLGLGSVLGSGGGSVTELDDVTLINADDGDILQYSAQSSTWTNVQEPTARKVPLAPGTTCTAGQLLASTTAGYVLADCKSLETIQGLVYAVKDCTGGMAYTKDLGTMPITSNLQTVGKAAYVGYNGNYTVTPTVIGGEYIKAIGVIKSETELLFNSDTLAIRVYLG